MEVSDTGAGGLWAGRWRRPKTPDLGVIVLAHLQGHEERRLGAALLWRARSIFVACRSDRGQRAARPMRSDLPKVEWVGNDLRLARRAPLRDRSVGGHTVLDWEPRAGRRYSRPDTLAAPRPGRAGGLTRRSGVTTGRAVTPDRRPRGDTRPQAAR